MKSTNNLRGALIDLGPETNGDRIAVVKGSKVAYLPATRVNLGAAETGSSGCCRYIKRAANGNLYVTGPGLGDQLFRSSDGGYTWTTHSMQLNAGQWIWMAAFSILGDDTFLMLLMPSNWTVNTEAAIARSCDYGKTWSIQAMNACLHPYKYVQGGNSDILELADGSVLATVDLLHGDEHDDLPPEQQGVFSYAFRSFDGGQSWPEKTCITSHAAETHLLQLPSGRLLAAIRKQRWHRLPGDLADVVEVMQQHGWTPAAGGGLWERGEGSNRIKNMCVSESYDGGSVWVNEQEVTPQMKCSGDLAYLSNGTLVLLYLHRYDGPIAREGIRARVSYDQGATWEPEEYVLSDGAGRYPGGIETPQETVIATCPFGGQLQVVHWRPLDKHEVASVFKATETAKRIEPPPALSDEGAIDLVSDGKTTKLPATRVNILPPPAPGVKHAAICYGRNSALLQRGGKGDLYCMGNVMGPRMARSKDGGRTWDLSGLDIEGWGSLVGFLVGHGERLTVIYEPVGAGHHWLCIAVSIDGGKSYRTGRAEVDVHPHTHLTGKDNNMIELFDGTLLVGLQLWGDVDRNGAEEPTTDADRKAYVLRSTDGGRSWGEPVSICSLAGMARLIRLMSGKLLACVYAPHSQHLMLAESIDEGRSWANVRAVASEVNPGGETGNLSQLTDGTVVLQFLYDASTAKNRHLDWYTVEGLRAILSHDDGHTWDKRVYVIGDQVAAGSEPTGQGAYLGDSLELSNGKILTACVHHADSGMRFQGVHWQPWSRS